MYLVRILAGGHGSTAKQGYRCDNNALGTEAHGAGSAITRRVCKTLSIDSVELRTDSIWNHVCENRVISTYFSFINTNTRVRNISESVLRISKWPYPICLNPGSRSRSSSKEFPGSIWTGHLWLVDLVTAPLEYLGTMCNHPSLPVKKFDSHQPLPQLTCHFSLITGTRACHFSDFTALLTFFFTSSTRVIRFAIVECQVLHSLMLGLPKRTKCFSPADLVTRSVTTACG